MHAFIFNGLLLLLVSTLSYTKNDFKEFISNNIPLREDGRIYIPHHIKHVKLDIGLSYFAPMSQYWLTHENDLIVFGFEPNPPSVESLLNGAIIQHPSLGAPLEKRFVGTSFFLIPCALGLSSQPFVKLFVTKNCDCSSIYKSKEIVNDLEIERVINVPIFSLADFFDLFPFDTHPVIDYINIDTQGADLDIAKSAGSYLKDKVIYITLEAENSHYANTVNSQQDIQNYMDSIGFVKCSSFLTSDPTYFNPRFAKYIKQNVVTIYQQG
jgi:hypothetical protein